MSKKLQRQSQSAHSENDSTQSEKLSSALRKMQTARPKEKKTTVEKAGTAKRTLDINKVSSKKRKKSTIRGKQIVNLIQYLLVQVFIRMMNRQRANEAVRWIIRTFVIILRRKVI